MSLRIGRSCDQVSSAAQDPNPRQFKIQLIQEWDTHPYMDPVCVCVINYTGCTTYKGNKLLILEGTEAEILSRCEIDPHFLESENAPIARFPPTGKGQHLANVLLNALGYKRKK